MTDTAQSQTPKRELGFAAAVGIVVGQSIALGIFLTPASMAKSLGSPLLLLIVWLALAVMTLCGALCYSELGIRFPQSGGEVIYLREGFGETASFLYGWTGGFVMYPGVAAALAYGTGAYLAQIFPFLNPIAAFLPALAILFFTVINILGTKLSGSLLSFVSVLKLVILFGLVAWALFSGHASSQNLFPFVARRAGSDPIIPALAGAAMGAFFSFAGWWEIGKVAGEIRNPKKFLPLAFVMGVSIVAVIYILVSFVFLSVIPVQTVTDSPAFVAQFGSVLFGSAGGRILSACVVLCVASGLSALMMVVPRITYSMAQNGLFFPAFAKLSPRWNTPVNAILLQAALAIGVLLLGAFDRILAYIIFSAVLLLAITVSVLFRLTPRVDRWWYPAAPTVYIAFSVVIGGLILMRSPVPALIGVAAVLAGLPLRRVFSRR
ncbi:MAG TPA: amino acid permease [Candidatus Acidoferrum sp.]|jgi:APA family basic amino acid/polyamine antiporter